MPNERRRLIPRHIGQRRELDEAQQWDTSAVDVRQAERRPGNPPHTEWLQDSGERLTTVDRRVVEVWELRHIEDQAILSAWAAHFRNHYCSDADLPDFVAGTGMTAAQYLVSIKFPDATIAPGPSVRAGDFAEILVADFIEFVLGYWCPRELRYQDRWNRNDSTKGCDVVGFKFASEARHDPNDELFIFEAKAAMSPTNRNRLQDAVDDSAKDAVREAMTLNAIKQRFLERRDRSRALRVQRFQDMADRPFRRISGAAAVLDNGVFEAGFIAATDTEGHPNVGNLKLIVIRGAALMDLVHGLYERAGDEA
jgi:hypothetical protein